MGRVGGEFPLHAKSTLQPVERLIDRFDQRADFHRNVFSGDTNVGAHRTDVLRVPRRLDQRSHGAAENDDVGGQQQKQNRERDPSDVLEEIGDDIVGQDVAMRKILADLDDDRTSVNFLRNAYAEDDLVFELDFADFG